MIQITELPEEQFFLFIDGKSQRVMLSTSDIKAIELPNGEDLVLTIITWDNKYIFQGSDASEIEEFLISRKAYSPLL
jgi:hypothetical protein